MIKQTVFCFLATLFFSIIMNSPKRAILWSSLIAAAGYIIYLESSAVYGELFGYFLGTLIIASFGELCARKIKMPATIFIFPGIVPLVPGLGLYRMMLAFVQNDIGRALEVGVSTIFIAGVMAISMAVINLIVLKIPVKR